MGIYKSTWIFDLPSQKMGWSESWYINANTKPIAHQNSITVANYRLAGLTDAAMISVVRTTANVPPFTPNVMRQRDILIDFVALPGSVHFTKDQGTLGFVSAKVRMTSTPNETFAIREFRGLPELVYDNGTDKLARSIIEGMLLTMRPFMTQLGFANKHVVRGTPPTTRFDAITDSKYEGLSRRATGRPSFLPRGRKFAKRMHP